jgi:Uma2 family endonuclease
MSSAPRDWISPEQYLAIERRATERHEYYRGEMFAMSGASREHNLIAGNLARALGNRFVGRPCETYTSDMRVRIDRSGLYTYPDVVVVCGEPRFLDAEVDTLLNPTVLMEVLSKSTEAHDRGFKSASYRLIPSMWQYVIVAQDRMAVECYTRRGEVWELSDARGAEATLRLESLGVEIPLSEVYERVTISLEDESETGKRQA